MFQARPRKICSNHARIVISIATTKMYKAPSFRWTMEGHSPMSVGDLCYPVRCFWFQGRGSSTLNRNYVPIFWTGDEVHSKSQLRMYPKALNRKMVEFVGCWGLRD